MFSSAKLHFLTFLACGSVWGPLWCLGSSWRLPHAKSVLCLLSHLSGLAMLSSLGMLFASPPTQLALCSVCLPGPCSPSSCATTPFYSALTLALSSVALPWATPQSQTQLPCPHPPAACEVPHFQPPGYSLTTQAFGRDSPIK